MIHGEIFWTVVCATVATQAALFILGSGVVLAVNAVKRSRVHRATEDLRQWSCAVAREYPISGGVLPESMILGKVLSRTCPYCKTVMVECAQPTVAETTRAPVGFYGTEPGRCPSCQSLQSGMASVSPAPWFRRWPLAGNYMPPAQAPPEGTTPREAAGKTRPPDEPERF